MELEYNLGYFQYLKETLKLDKQLYLYIIKNIKSICLPLQAAIIACRDKKCL